jgi:hypothetical protein
MAGLADPGGRYTVELVRHGLVHHTEAGGLLANALNEGDAKGWHLVHMVYSDINPAGIYIVWDKQGANPSSGGG